MCQKLNNLKSTRNKHDFKIFYLQNITQTSGHIFFFIIITINRPHYGILKATAGMFVIVFKHSSCINYQIFIENCYFIRKSQKMIIEIDFVNGQSIEIIEKS